MPIDDINSTSPSDNAVSEIADGSQSGNKADVTANKELKVITTANDNAIPYQLPSKIKWEDMAVVARNTVFSTSLTFTTVYTYTGNGFFYGFNLNLEDSTNDWFIRLNIDGNFPLFGSTGILTSDFNAAAGYDISGLNSTSLRLGRIDNVTRLDLHYPIKFSNNVLIEIRRSGTNKRFFAGYVMIHKN